MSLFSMILRGFWKSTQNFKICPQLVQRKLFEIDGPFGISDLKRNFKFWNFEWRKIWLEKHDSEVILFWQNDQKMCCFLFIFFLDVEFVHVEFLNLLSKKCSFVFDARTLGHCELINLVVCLRYVLNRNFNCDSIWIDFLTSSVKSEFWDCWLVWNLPRMVYVPIAGWVEKMCAKNASSCSNIYITMMNF